MTRIQLRQPAPAGSGYAPNAFDSQIGKEVPFNIDGNRRGLCAIVAAEVTEDGSAALLTVDVPDDDFGGRFLATGVREGLWGLGAVSVDTE